MLHSGAGFRSRAETSKSGSEGTHGLTSASSAAAGKHRSAFRRGRRFRRDRAGPAHTFAPGAVVAGTSEAELGTPAPSGTWTDPTLAIFSLLLALGLALPGWVSYYHARGTETDKSSITAIRKYPDYFLLDQTVLPGNFRLCGGCHRLDRSDTSSPPDHRLSWHGPRRRARWPG
jgi:hypothetical protein